MKHLDFDISAHVSRETADRLRRYVDLLFTWNGRINLIGRSSEADIWRRHIADSLQLLPLLGPSEAVADLGSGAGFPGLVLAIASSREVHLIESDQRKAAFLREAARQTSTHVNIHACRAESLRLEPFPVVTARAFAPLSRLLQVAAPLLRTDGTCFCLKGRGAARELTDALAAWHMRVEMMQSRTDPEGSILRIRDIKAVEHAD